MMIMEILQRTEVTSRYSVQKHRMLCELSFWQQRFLDSSRMTFLFVATSHGESAFGEVCAVKMAGSKNQYTLVFTLHIVIPHQILGWAECTTATTNFTFVCLLVLREGYFFIPLLHKCQSCMWHTGALCLSANKKDLLATDCYFYCSRFVNYCVCQHREVWCTGKAKY